MQTLRPPTPRAPGEGVAGNGGLWDFFPVRCKMTRSAGSAAETPTGTPPPQRPRTTQEGDGDEQGEDAAARDERDRPRAGALRRRLQRQRRELEHVDAGPAGQS